MKSFAALFRRDILLAWKSQSEIALVLMFFLATGALFPLALGPDLALLSQIAGGTGLTLLSLAALNSMDRLFASDWEDGSLDLIFKSPLSPESLILSKAFSHWCSNILPLLLILPLLGIMLGLGKTALLWLTWFAFLASPGLSLLGSFGAALCLGSSRAGLLMIFLVLPLYTPFLIFGAIGYQSALQGIATQAPIFILVGLNLLVLAILPWIGGKVLTDALSS